MQTSTVVALIVAPLLGGLIWKGLHWPGHVIHDFLWRKLPDGKLRNILLKKVS